MIDCRYLVFLLVGVLLAACTIQEQKTSTAFESLKTSFVNNLWELNPTRALSVGNFNYDDRLTIKDEMYRQNRDRFLSKYEKIFCRRSCKLTIV